MVLRKFTNIYPRTFWIAIIEKEEDLQNICKQFTLYKIQEGFDEELEKPLEFIESNLNTSTVAECIPVMKNSNGEYGIICVIYRPSVFDNSFAAHESVHITDYYFEVTGMSAQDFSDAGGDEHFAYLVGWCAGCFTKVMKEYYGKTE